jgi:ATP-dependent Lhr-like helicase
MEIAALVSAMRAAEVEPTRVVQNAIDVLAQVIVAAVSVDDWNFDDLFRVIRRAYPYHRLSRGAYEETVAMLSGKYPSDLAAELEPRITWDKVSSRLSGSRAARMTAVISGGTIPDRGLYTVNLPDRTRLGELDEEFVHESRVGDVFQLGSTTWRIAAIEHDRVVVNPAPGMPARMPFWHGEYGARSLELSHRVSALRRKLAEMPDDGVLESEYSCDAATARSLIEYVRAQKAATGMVPDDQNIVVEHFRDETGSIRVVIHAAFGGRVNAPWGMALAQRARDALKATDVQVQTTDDGIMLRLPDLGTIAPLSVILGMTAGEASQLVMEEVGSTSLFGARFRMNAARALLLPRGNPRRRMPLWLQRLKALDLLQTVQQFPSFPILVETYRDVLQDAFDMPGLQSVLNEIEARRIKVHIVETQYPSPFAASLQFGFVMDWLYGDDTPRAEQKAALLALDRSLLGEVMGEEAGDDLTLDAIGQIIAQRAGTAEGRQARSADDLANLLDRAGDLTLDELQARVSAGEERRDPFGELLASQRIIALPFASGETQEWRFILTESYGRYASAFGDETVSRVLVSSGGSQDLVEVDAAEVVPEALRRSVITQPAARREILARYLALSGPVTIAEIEKRYGWDSRWIESRLTEWQRTGKLVAGRFRSGIGAPEWCSKRVAEAARRRALAALRKQIEAVDVHVFAELLQRWQHVDPRDRLEGATGLAAALRQLYGVARPAVGWERDYLRSRVTNYDPTWLSQLASSGEMVWVAETAESASVEGPARLSRARFFERGTGRLWLDTSGYDESVIETRLSEEAIQVFNFVRKEGASFIGDIQAGTGLMMQAVRRGLRELASLSVVTNDTIEALREVVRWRALPPQSTIDPTRWLPADYTPSPDRRVVQRRPNLRRLPRWRRPDRPGGVVSSWSGRWSLVNRLSVLGPELSEEDLSARIARQWLDRYGIVTRECWKKERPTIRWRSIYLELKRLEFRGEARRGYFIRGFGGAQFAAPAAVEMLRMIAAEDSSEAPFVVIAASDPANVYSLAIDSELRDPLSRPRGGGALLVTKGGRVAIAVEGRGRRLTIADWMTREEVDRAKEILSQHLRGEKGARYLMLPDIRSS